MVYLLHFLKPYKHARHYLGYADDFEKRIKRHKNGRGARLLQVLKENNIDFVVARTWEGDRAKERQLKNLKKNPRLCPICIREKKKIGSLKNGNSRKNKD